MPPERRPARSATSHEPLAAASIAASLVLGLAVYLFARPPVLVMHGLVEPLIGAGFVANGGHWLTNSLPFALWCFAAFVALRRSRWGAVALSLAAGAELGQLAGVVPGTFDPIDLLAITIAFGIAQLLPAAAGRGPSDLEVDNGAGPTRTRGVEPRPTRAIATLAVFALLCAATSEDPKKKAEREAKEKEALAELETYMNRLAEIHDALAALDLSTQTERPCDQAAMLEAPAVEHGHLNLRTVSLDFLDRFGEDSGAWKKSEGPWAFLDDDTFAGHFAEHPDDRDAYALKDTASRVQETFLAERYLIVVVPDGADGKVAPVMRSDSFDSGYFDGWIFVVNQTDASIACQAPITVQSSDSIDFGGRLDSKDPENEMFEDFEDNFEAAIGAKLPPKIKLATSFGSILF